MKIAISDRLKAYRISSGRSPEEIAKTIGVSTNEYYDAESYTEEITLVFDLVRVRTLCRLLNTTVRSLLSGHPDGVDSKTEKVSFYDLSQLLNQYVSNNNITLELLEDQAGWEFHELLVDEFSAWQWPFQRLSDLCRCIEVDVNSVLAWVDSQ